MGKNKILSILNCFALLAVLIVNALANSLPIAGRDTAEISNTVDFLFKPAGYVFSIWGIIYLGLILFAAAQFFRSIREIKLSERIGPWFMISCAANAGWLFLWHYMHLGWSVLVMFILLFSLIMIYLQIRSIQGSAFYQWAVRIPFSLYLGWISVAAIANISITLKSSGWQGWGIPDTGWLIIMLCAGLILLFLMAYLRRDIVYAMVLLWAFIGIGVQHQGRNPLPLIAFSAAAAAVLITAGALKWGACRSKQKSTS